MDEFRQFVQLKPSAPSTPSKPAPRRPSHPSVELFWIDEVVTQHRRTLINTHAQKRSRLLKRLKDTSGSQAEPAEPKKLGKPTQCLRLGSADSTGALAAPGNSRHSQGHDLKDITKHIHTDRQVSDGCPPCVFGPLPENLLLGFDHVVMSSVSMTSQAGSLLKFAQILALSTETISSHWGKSCVASLGLSWSLSSPVRLLNLLERASAYVDTVQGVEVSPRTIFWRHAVIRRLSALVSDPSTRYSDEVLTGIISLLHGYLHRYAKVGQGTAITEGPHSAGLRDFVSHHGGWSRISLPTQAEQFVRMSMIMTSRRLASYLENVDADSAGQKLLQGWHEEVQQVVSQFSQMAAWAWENSQDCAKEDHGTISDELRQLLAAEESGICDHCHKIFILVWLGLAKWHSRTNILRYEHAISALNHRFQSLPHKALQDLSWAIISSRVGDERSHWQTIEVLKVLHRTRSSTQEQVCQWLFDFTCDTGTGVLVDMAAEVCEQIWKDALEGLPKIPSHSS